MEQKSITREALVNVFNTKLDIDELIVEKEKTKIELIDIVAKQSEELELIKSEIMISINNEKSGDKPVYSNDKARESELNRRLKEHKTYNDKKELYISSVRARHFIDVDIESLKRKYEMFRSW